MLGHVLFKVLSQKKNYNIFDITYRKKIRDQSIICNVENIIDLKKNLNKIKPDIIVNCIGVLINESNIDVSRAIYINSFIPQWLKNHGDINKIKIIHLSTDCVFNGGKGDYDENSFPDAEDIYGKTKALGEFQSKNHLCIRTSIIGPELKSSGQGLMNWIFLERGIINGFKNVYWSGITTLELSKAIDFSIQNKISGLWNLGSKEKISKYDLLKLIIKIFKISKIILNEDFKKQSDKSLKSIRKINYNVPSYPSMIKELKIYLLSNIKDYSYSILKKI